MNCMNAQISMRKICEEIVENIVQVNISEPKYQFGLKKLS